MKPAVFHPTARLVLQEFPEEVRRELGKAIFDLQKGHKLSMPLSRPIKALGKGSEELRIGDRSGTFRVFYFARLATAVLVFHAFQKKTRETPKQEIEIGRARLKEMLDEK
jgi:phage-related protein